MDRRSFLSRMLVMAGGLAAVAATARHAEAFTAPTPVTPAPLQPETAVLGEGDAPAAEQARWVWRRPRRRVIVRRRRWYWRRPRRRVWARRRVWRRRRW